MTRRALTTLLSILMLAFGLIAAPATASEPDFEAEFVSAINASRAAEGMPPLATYYDLEDDARNHSAQMMSEDFLHHNPALGSVTTGWYGLGENVGVGPTVGILHDAFMNSPGHMANILGNFNYVGVGVEIESDYKMWVTVVFMRGPEGLSDPARDADTKEPIPPGGDTVEPVRAPVDRDETVGMVDPATGRWHLVNRDGTVKTFYYGNPGDYPMVGDWNCDGVETPGLYRQSDGYVYLRNSNNQGIADIKFYFGNPGDMPLAGDFDGDGCDSVSIFRPSSGTVYVINKLGSNDHGLGAADFSYSFGSSTDTPVVGDFDGNGIDTVAFYGPDGVVRYRNAHSDATPTHAFPYGGTGDRAVVGDWTGDGVATIGVFDPDTNRFNLRHENNAGTAHESFTYGGDDWLPIAGVFDTTG